MDIKYLEKLTNANGTSGYEQNIAKIMEEKLKDNVNEIYYDNIGSLIAHKNGKGPKVMLAAHLDEVGFLVKDIDEKGFIKFIPVGGWWNQVLLGQKVCICSNDKKIYGVIGSKPPHVLTMEQRKKTVEIKDMFIDIGVYNKKEVLDLGINIGDMITPVGDLSIMNNSDFIMAKALDNRIGCYIVTKIMEELSKDNLDIDLYGVATVQEEIGLRGARTSSNLINPDIAIAIDTGIAGDTPGMTRDDSMSNLGDGLQIIVMDRTTFGSVNLRKKLQEIAEKNNIKYQLDFTPGGGTDAGEMHLTHDGSLGISLSVATRYIHSHLSIINKNDVDNLVHLMVEFCRWLNEENYQELKK